MDGDRKEQVRLATPDDAPAILEIYAPLVESTAISFEIEPPTLAEMRQRIIEIGRAYPWLAWEEGGNVTGYVYAGPHRARKAYQWSVEVSSYVHPDHRRRGIGSRLYRGLFELLRRQGYRNAYAGITLPNPASVRLHESLGFAPVGIYREIGFKLGSWHDVGWWHLVLQDLSGKFEPAPPIPFSELEKKFQSLQHTVS